jgi:hypothetical protein
MLVAVVVCSFSSAIANRFSLVLRFRRAEGEGTIAKLVAQEYNRRTGGYYAMDCRQTSGRRRGKDGGRGIEES